MHGLRLAACGVAMAAALWSTRVLGSELLVADAQKTLAEEKVDAHKLFSLSFFFDNAGRPFSALKAIERAIELNGTVPGYHARYGQMLLARKRIKEAGSAYGRAADMDPATMSFRAAQARALASCGMHHEAAEAWTTILNSVTDRKEVLDSADQLFNALIKTNSLNKAEAAWKLAWEKLEQLDDRLNAATRTADLILAQRNNLRAFSFYQNWMAQETDWPVKARILEAARHVVDGTSDAAVMRDYQKCWEEMLLSAKAPADKQRMAKGLAIELARSGNMDAAIETITPHLFTGDWASDFGAVEQCARTYAASGNDAAAIAVWRDLLKRSSKLTEKANVLGYLERYLPDRDSKLAAFKELLDEFPDEPDAIQSYAARCAEAERYGEALALFEKMISLLQKRKDSDKTDVDHHLETMIGWAIRTNDREMAIKVIRQFQNPQHYTILNFLHQMSNANGQSEALIAASTIGTQNAPCALAAGCYLRNTDSTLGIEMLALAARAGAPGVRREAWQELQRSLIPDSMKIGILPHMIAMPSDTSQHNQEIRELAVLYARQSRFENAEKLVREAASADDKNKFMNASAVLRDMSNELTKGQLISRGIASSEKIQPALAMVERLYQDFSTQAEMLAGLVQAIANLSNAQMKLSGRESALRYLNRIIEIRNDPALRLHALSIHERSDDKDAVWHACVAYTEALTERQLEDIKSKEPEQRQLPVVGEKLVSIVEKLEKADALAEMLSNGVDEKQAVAQQAAAEVLLAWLKATGQPKRIVALLDRLKTMGYGGSPYDRMRDWSISALNLNNTTSRADVLRREELLRDVQRWAQLLQQNPEDYQAAINAFKTYLLLGRKAEGAPFLDKALSIAPLDPLLLELHGRELMLDKNYLQAAREFEQAAQIAGRREDFDASILTALELSGQHVQALQLCLDSIQMQQKQVRTLEQILDLAERSSNMNFLQQDLARRLAEFKTRKQSVPDDLSLLSLRTAWSVNDHALGDSALDAMLARSLSTSRNLPGRGWSDLARQAEQHKKLNDAARLWEATIIESARRHGGVNPGDYEAFARILLEQGEVEKATHLLFDALDRATLQAAEMPIGPALWDSNGRVLTGSEKRSRAASTLTRQSRRQWTSMIISLAARDNRLLKATGNRLVTIINDELSQFAMNPRYYSGPFSSNETTVLLGINKQVDELLATAAKDPDSGYLASLFIAERLSQAAAREGGRTDLFEKIHGAAKAAFDAAPLDKKGAIAVDIANMYSRLFSVPEKNRLPGLSAEAVLDTCDQALSAGSFKRLELLRQAAALAEAQKKDERWLKYARSIHELQRGSFQSGETLVRALIANGHIKEAGEVAFAQTGKNPNSAMISSLSTAFEKCAGKSTEAALIAVELLDKTILAIQTSSYVVLADNGRLEMDKEVYSLRSRKAAALAGAEKFDEAIAEFSVVVRESGKNASAHCGDVAAIFVAKGRAQLLNAALEAEVQAQPKDVQRRLALARMQEKMDAGKALVGTLTAAKALRPELDTIKWLISALRKQGDFGAARSECKVWLANFPFDQEAMQTMAAICREMKDNAGEIRALTMMLDALPRDAARCRKVALMFARREDFKRTLALLERAMELRAEEPARMIDLAEACYIATDFKRAESLCLDALGKDWERGVSPELRRRTLEWRGTFETRANALLAESYEAQNEKAKAENVRINLPAGYVRESMLAEEQEARQQ